MKFNSMVQLLSIFAVCIIEPVFTFFVSFRGKFIQNQSCDTILSVPSYRIDLVVFCRTFIMTESLIEIKS